MNSFWESIWSGSKAGEYQKYINIKTDYQFIDIFKMNKILSVCDAGCGFGKYSVICAYNGFEVSGFDISETAVAITKEMLNKYNLKFKDYRVCSITNINFDDRTFDGVVAHSVIDHLTYIDAEKAVNELLRVTKKNGLIYVSFDALEEDDISLPHIVLEDGSLKYTSGKRKDMIFRYYKNDEIKGLFKGFDFIYFNVNEYGERDIIIKKL